MGKLTKGQKLHYRRSERTKLGLCYDCGSRREGEYKTLCNRCGVKRRRAARVRLGLKPHVMNGPGRIPYVPERKYA